MKKKKVVELLEERQKTFKGNREFKKNSDDLEESLKDHNSVVQEFQKEIKKLKGGR